MKRKDVKPMLNYYGYEVKIMNKKVGYTDRKCTVYGVYCRRTNRLECSYTSFNQIYKWLNKTLGVSEKNESKLVTKK